MPPSDVNWLDGEGLMTASSRLHAEARKARRIVSLSDASLTSSRASDESVYGDDKNAKEFTAVFLPLVQSFREDIQGFPDRVEATARGVANMGRAAFRTDEANREEGENLHRSFAGNSYPDAGGAGSPNVSDVPLFSPDTSGGGGGGASGDGAGGSGTSGRR